MLTRFRNLIGPPVFEDEDKTRTAGVLNTILLAMLLYVVLVGSIAVPFVFVEKLYSSLFILAGLVMFAVAYWLMRCGRVRLASTIFVCTLWIISTIFMLLSGGMTSVVAALYVTGTVAAGLLLGARDRGARLRVHPSRVGAVCGRGCWGFGERVVSRAEW